MTFRNLARREFLAALAGTSAAAACPGVLHALAFSMDPDPASIAHDPNRPACHLLPPHNWMNDPNGPIYWKGQYHLFYQLNPHAAVWGDMHWGHAVSPDMIHWRHQQMALAPTPGGPDSEGCFSGSAVVYDGRPAFIYTGVQNAPPDQATLRDGNDKLRETQLLATAEDDHLLRWTKVPVPVIAAPPPGVTVTGFRDPCPWREADGWYLAVGSGERGKGGCALLFRSHDLHYWEYLHKLAEGKPNGRQAANPCDSGEMWECPDFFPLGKQHCLLYSTEGKVIWTTGEYDTKAHTFRPVRSGVLDHGAYYAPKSFQAHDGRRILWGWIQETRPEAEYAAAGWAGVMSYPRVLTIGAQGQLEMHPAREMEKLRGAEERATVTAEAPFHRKLDELTRELHLDINLFLQSVIAVRLLVESRPAWEMIVDVPARQVRCGEIEFPFPGLPWPRPDLRMFLDGSVIECFIGGREALTSRVYTLKPGETEVAVTVEGKGRIDLITWPLTPISPDRLST